MKRFSFIIAALLPASLPAAAQASIDPAELAGIRAELQEPLSVYIGKQQQPVHGHVTDISKNQIQVKTAVAAGEITFTFERDRITGFSLPGESYKTLALEWMASGRDEDALELMRQLFEQRKTLLPMLPAAESHFFVYYVRLILDSPKPARAIAIADMLRPQIESPAALHTLDDAILESYHSIELYKEARQLAEAWIQARPPYGDSALGYYVLAADHLRAGQFEDALELALQPVVFSSVIPVEKLGGCYAAAASAALSLRDKDYASTLYREMQARQLSWPEDDPILTPFHQKLLQQIKDL